MPQENRDSQLTWGFMDAKCLTQFQIIPQHLVKYWLQENQHGFVLQFCQWCGRNKNRDVAKCHNLWIG